MTNGQEIQADLDRALEINTGANYDEVLAVARQEVERRWNVTLSQQANEGHWVPDDFGSRWQLTYLPSAASDD